MDTTKVTHHISKGRLVTVTTTVTATPLDYIEGEDSPLDPIIADAISKHPSYSEWGLNEQIKITHLARELLNGYTGGTLEQKAAKAVNFVAKELFPEVPPPTIEDVVEKQSKVDIFTPEEKHKIIRQVERTIPYFTGDNCLERATSWVIYIYNRDKTLYEAVDVCVAKLLLSDRGRELISSRARYLLTYDQLHSPEQAVSKALQEYQSDTLGKVAY